MVCFTVLGMFFSFSVFWFCSFLLGVCTNSQFLAIPRLEMFGSGFFSGRVPSRDRPKAWALPDLKLYCAVDQLATQESSESVGHQKKASLLGFP